MGRALYYFMIIIFIYCLPTMCQVLDRFFFPNAYTKSFFFFFWLCHVACRILVPYQGLNLDHGSESAES